MIWGENPYFRKHPFASRKVSKDFVARSRASSNFTSFSASSRAFGLAKMSHPIQGRGKGWGIFTSFVGVTSPPTLLIPTLTSLRHKVLPPVKVRSSLPDWETNHFSKNGSFKRGKSGKSMLVLNGICCIIFLGL